MKKAPFLNLFSPTLALIICFSGCNPTKNVPKGKYLLVNNKVEIVGNEDVDLDEFSSYIKQKPNRKILFFRFHLWLYNRVNLEKEKERKEKREDKLKRINERRKKKGKERKERVFSFSQWLLDIGEPPVILDTVLTNRTVRQFKLYMHSKGYFNGEAEKEIIDVNKKKKKVVYKVYPKKPYTIRKIDYDLRDEGLRKYIFYDTMNCILKKNDIYDADQMQEERKRIAKNLKNKGFYYFNKENIIFLADSTAGNHQVDIKVQFRDLITENESDTLKPKELRMYKIKNIFIYPDYNKTVKAELFDTLTIHSNPKDSTDQYHFLITQKPRVKPKTITRSIFFENGQYFNLEDTDKTYRRLSDMKIFKFINIQFKEIEPVTASSDTYFLNTEIQLTRLPVHATNYEIEGTTSTQGDLGVSGNVIYQNKNLFRGAEIFNIRLKGAMEFQRLFYEDTLSDSQVIEQLPFFNTVETGIEAGIDIPKFLLPIPAENFSKNNVPITSIKTGFNYQRRPDYARSIINFKYGYNWKESEFRKVYIHMDINSVKIDPDSSFVVRLNQFKNKKLLNSYQDHLTTAFSISVIHNAQRLNKQEDFIFWRHSLEPAGSMPYLIHSAANKEKTYNEETESSYYTLFGIRYSQYIRYDTDFRYYHYLPNKKSLVGRVYFGIGYPYGNSNVLPFEKSFYAGGSNGLRAWHIRSIGPGSFKDTTNQVFDKTGDLHIETNLEYRFPIFGIFHGALFTDIGNVWLLTENEDFPGGTFTFDSFIYDIAADVGVGMRLDLGFFIVRLDFATPVRHPGYPKGQRWITDTFKTISDISTNLGIGYPF